MWMVGWLVVAAVPVLEAQRAVVFDQLQGNVALSVSTPRPGGGRVDPDGRLSGKLGFGLGFQGEVAVYRTSEGVFRPSVGLQYQIFSSPAFGLGTQIQYVPEGFREAEGEIELQLLATGHLGALEITANLVGGTEPELAEGDVEAKLLIGYSLFDRLLLGIEGQSRFGVGEGDFGEEQDHYGAAVLQTGVESFFLTALFGAGARIQDEVATVGPFALARVEYRF